MAKPVHIMIARFPGNYLENPPSVNWVLETAMHAKVDDDRVAKVTSWWKSDTPIDMVRNDAVHHAQNIGADILFMVDSDMAPDAEGGGEKFYDVAMDFLYGREQPSVIAAPYVGGGLNNNVFVFRWRNSNNGDNFHFALNGYSREEAAEQTGITEVAALPTGLIAYDMRVFDRLPDEGKGYFYYEMNKNRTRKESTEDVTNTRDISLAWHDVDGAGCFCAWDCWAHHLKIVPCEKPKIIPPSLVGSQLHKAFTRDLDGMTETEVDVTSEGVDLKSMKNDSIEDSNGRQIVYVGSEQEAEFAQTVKDRFNEFDSPEDI